MTDQLNQQPAEHPLGDSVLNRIEEIRSAAAFSYDEAFSRNLGLVSEEEQQRLRNARVAIVGMGGVGGVHLATLARLGVGKFSIADLDDFEFANMNRQYGARVDTIGRPKVDVMAEEVLRINPEAELRVFREGVQEETLDEFLDGADLFVDGIDFFSIGLRRQLFRRPPRRESTESPPARWASAPHGCSSTPAACRLTRTSISATHTASWSS